MAGKGATAARKRKVSNAGPRMATKRRAKSRKRPDAAEESSNTSPVIPGEPGSDDDLVIEVRWCPLNWLRNNRQLQCDRCVKDELVCVFGPRGSCQRCGVRKQACSLNPPNAATGRPIRRQLTDEEILEYRLNEAKTRKEEAKREAVKKGKKAVVIRNSPDPPESEGSRPSPAVTMALLGKLVLDSGASSAGTTANTPADSPAALPPPPFPEGNTAAPPSEPQPGISQPRSSDSSSMAARMTAMEQRQELVEQKQELLEKRQERMERRLNEAFQRLNKYVGA